MSGLRSMLVNISTSSVTTAIFTLFAYGLLTGGTSFVWAYALGFAVLLLVTLMFSELGSDMPIAGALYQWSSRVVGPKYGYVSAWIYIAAQIGITGAVAYGIAPFVGSLFNWELTIGQTQLMAIAIVVVCLVINLIGVRLASGTASLGAAAEVAGMVVLTVVLLVVGLGNQPASVLVESKGLPDGSEFLPVALATMLFGSWAYTGLEMTTDMAEETKDASRVIPRAAIGSLVTTFVVGMIFLVVAVLAIPNDAVFASANPLQAIIEGNTSVAFYKVMLVTVIIAVFACTIANQALTARAVFSLARDGKAPGAKALMKVPKSTRVPAVALTVVSVLTCILLLFTDAIATIAVAALTALFVVYMMVIWAQLVQRLRGRWTPRGWSLGRWSTTVNVLAAVLGTLLTLNIAWPRGEGIAWYNKWSGFLFVGVAVALALAYYLLGGRKVRESIERPLAGSRGAAAPGTAPVGAAAGLAPTPASETPTG
jgi:amino acid transporter